MRRLIRYIEVLRSKYNSAGLNRSLAAVKLLALLLIISSCDYRAERTERESPIAEEVLTEQPTADSDSYAYRVFLENSGSMDGYVRGTTAFEDDIYKLLVDISYLADTVQVNYINSKVIPFSSGIQNFVSKLEPASFQQRGGNRSSSNLNQVFRQVLQAADTRQVSVLISDCIFSAEGGNTEEKLNNQKISIYNTFRSQLQQHPFATLIIKMSSTFNGSYYNKNDQPVALNIQRPYYIWLTGPQEALATFKSQVSLQQLGGFENTYWLTAGQEASEPFFTVLSNYHKTGNFRTDRRYSGNGYVHGIQNATPAGRGSDEDQFGFSIAVDMSGLPVDEDYLTNVDNYTVTGSYQLESIEPLDKISDMNTRDLAVVEKKATHVLTFMAAENTFADLTVSIKKQTPAWVMATQTDDDLNIKSDSAQQTKTFGFGYLVAGVEEAYQSVSQQNTYFTLDISVKK